MLQKSHSTTATPSSALRAAAGGDAPSAPPPRIDANGIVRGDAAGDAPERDEVEACKAFILTFGKPAASVVRSELHSYSLKHAVESWSRRLGGIPYVSNGAFLQAAAELNVPFEPVEDGSVNAYFALRWNRYRQAVNRGEA